MSVFLSLEWSYNEQIHIVQIDKWIKKNTSMQSSMLNPLDSGCPYPMYSANWIAGLSRRSHDETRGTLKSHRTGEDPKILLLPHCSQKSIFTRYGHAPSWMLYLGLSSSHGFPAFSPCLQYGWVAFRLSWGLVNICWRPGASLSSTMGFGLLSADCNACGVSVGFQVLLVCAEKSRWLFGACCISADFQVLFCFLQQGIGYCILSGASPYKAEAVDFVISLQNTWNTMYN